VRYCFDSIVMVSGGCHTLPVVLLTEKPVRRNPRLLTSLAVRHPPRRTAFILNMFMAEAQPKPQS